MKKLDHLSMLSKLSDTEKAQYALDKYIKSETTLNKVKIGFYVALIISAFAFVFAAFYNISTSNSANYEATKTERTRSTGSETTIEDEETGDDMTEAEKRELKEYEKELRKQKREMDAYRKIMFD